MAERNKAYTRKIAQLIEWGIAISQVAAQLGISYQAVRYHVRKYKIPYVPDSGRNRKALPDLAKLVAVGMTSGEIARLYKVDYKLVWKRIRRLGIPYQHNQSGSRNPSWKGGRRKAGKYVYIYCPAHPYATQAGCVLESRLVMELKLGRYLLPQEVVHHKRGYKNNPENLELFASNADHLAATLKGKIPKWTPAGRRRILAAVRLPRGPRKKSSRDKSETSA